MPSIERRTLLKGAAAAAVAGPRTGAARPDQKPGRPSRQGKSDRKARGYVAAHVVSSTLLNLIVVPAGYSLVAARDASRTASRKESLQ